MAHLQSKRVPCRFSTPEFSSSKLLQFQSRDFIRSSYLLPPTSQLPTLTHNHPPSQQRSLSKLSQTTDHKYISPYTLTHSLTLTHTHTHTLTHSHTHTLILEDTPKFVSIQPSTPSPPPPLPPPLPSNSLLCLEKESLPIITTATATSTSQYHSHPKKRMPIHSPHPFPTSPSSPLHTIVTYHIIAYHSIPQPSPTYRTTPHHTTPHLPNHKRTKPKSKQQVTKSPSHQAINQPSHYPTNPSRNFQQSTTKSLKLPIPFFFFCPSLSQITHSLNRLK